MHHQSHTDGGVDTKTRAFPLMIQGLRTNPKDPESHILCFDVEALIGINNQFHTPFPERLVDGNPRNPPDTSTPG